MTAPPGRSEDPERPWLGDSPTTRSAGCWSRSGWAEEIGQSPPDARNTGSIPVWYARAHEPAIVIRLPDQLASDVDQLAQDGSGSRAAVVRRARGRPPSPPRRTGRQRPDPHGGLPGLRAPRRGSGPRRPCRCATHAGPVDKTRPAPARPRDQVREAMSPATVAPITSTIKGRSTEAPVRPATGSTGTGGELRQHPNHRQRPARSPGRSPVRRPGGVADRGDHERVRPRSADPEARELTMDAPRPRASASGTPSAAAARRTAWSPPRGMTGPPGAAVVPLARRRAADRHRRRQPDARNLQKGGSRASSRSPGAPRA